MSRSVRTLGIALVLAVVGAAGAYGVGAMQTEDPRTISMVLPVPAQDPSYPVVEYDVLPDPTIAPLAAGLPLRDVRMFEGDIRLEAGVPVGWTVVDVIDDPTWNVSVQGNPTYTYILRVTAKGQSSVKVARDDRMNALRDAELNGGLQRVVFEKVTDDSFTATYLDDGHLRVAQERFVLVGPSVVDVSVVGREVDRVAAADLQARVIETLAYVPPKG